MDQEERLLLAYIDEQHVARGLVRYGAVVGPALNRLLTKGLVKVIDHDAVVNSIVDVRLGDAKPDNPKILGLVSLTPAGHIALLDPT